jgi:hypothetical protein
MRNRIVTVAGCAAAFLAGFAFAQYQDYAAAGWKAIHEQDRFLI